MKLESEQEVGGAGGKVTGNQTLMGFASHALHRTLQGAEWRSAVEGHG